MDFSKYERAQQLTELYAMALKALENDEANDYILVPFKRGDEKVEVIYTKLNGEKIVHTIHDPV